MRVVFRKLEGSGGGGDSFHSPRAPNNGVGVVVEFGRLVIAVVLVVTLPIMLPVAMVLVEVLLISEELMSAFMLAPEGNALCRVFAVGVLSRIIPSWLAMVLPGMSLVSLTTVSNTVVTAVILTTVVVALVVVLAGRSSSLTSDQVALPLSVISDHVSGSEDRIGSAGAILEVAERGVGMFDENSADGRYPTYARPAFEGSSDRPEWALAVSSKMRLSAQRHTKAVKKLTQSTRRSGERDTGYDGYCA